MRRTATAISLAALLCATSCGARSDIPVEQRRECRRLRAKAAFTGVGATVGVAVVATVLVVAVVASRGNIGGSSGGGRSRRARRRERRAHRHQVCYGQLEATPAEAPSPIAEVPTPTTEGPAEPPSEEMLVATFEGIEPDVRQCLGSTGVVQIDVGIDGPTGRVTGYAIQGMTATAAQGSCLASQLARLRFRPFRDEMRVRFAVDLGWRSP